MAFLNYVNNSQSEKYMKFTRHLSFDEQRALSEVDFLSYSEWLFRFNEPICLAREKRDALLEQKIARGEPTHQQLDME